MIPTDFSTQGNHYMTTKLALLRLIAQKIREQCDTLPPEETLAKQLGVSRMMIRDIFGELESCGYIARKRGKGTVINVQICNAQPRIDEEIDFKELFHLRGMELSVQLLDDRQVLPQEAGLPEGVQIVEGEQSLTLLERVFCGNGVPMIHSKVFFRDSNFAFDYRKWSGYAELTLCEFLEVFCRSKPNVNLGELYLAKAEGELAQKLQRVDGTPLLRIDDIRYDFDGHEIMRGVAHYCPEVLPLNLVRRKP